jgi:hypothetical protein
LVGDPVAIAVLQNGMFAVFSVHDVLKGIIGVGAHYMRARMICSAQKIEDIMNERK